MKIITNIAHWLSIIFSPILMGTYGIIIALWLSYLCFSPEKAKLTVIAATFIATCIIPVIGIFLLNRFGAIKDPKLNERTERTWPYIICAFCYLGIGIYYYFVHAPLWLSIFMFGATVALIILVTVNRWWKISGHATGMGALCGMIFFLMCSANTVVDIQWYFIAAIFLSGCVCTSRIILGRHALLQVTAGFFNGFICIFLPAILLQGVAIPYFQ